MEVIKYGIGIDMGKDKFHVCFGALNSLGIFKVKGQRKFANTPNGFKQVLMWIEKYRRDKNLDYQILMEVTGVYHENLLHYLHDKGYRVCLEMGKRVKRYLEMIGHKSKNDKLDGRGMSQMACERKGKLWKPCSPHLLEIRDLLRHRKALMQSKNQFENRLHATETRSGNHRDVRRSLKKLIKQLVKEIVSIEKHSRELLEKDPVLKRKVEMISDSVKGLGWLSVLVVVSETNGFISFKSRSQLVSYAGLDVVENSSGNYVGKTRISKRGNVRIRTALYMPSLAAVRAKSKPFCELYLRLISRNGGIKKKAFVAVQRKLLILIYTLWKKEEAFDIKYYESNTQELKVVVPM